MSLITIKLTSFFLSIVLFLSSIPMLLNGTSVVDITVDTTKQGSEVPNIVSNLNQWSLSSFLSPTKPKDNNIYDFVQYVKLMQCTGGTAERDLFVDPYDTTTLTDYDFSKLIRSCRGVLSMGAKPLLKLGGVPLKFTSDYKMGGFDMNVYPPDDYQQYYIYIRAVIQALVDEFGLEEVRSWRFGCMTECENGDWFMAKSGDPKESCEAFCKLYDYTVQAVLDVLGDKAFIGAHTMAVTEGLWDERDFIRHVAQGTNYANGKKGTHIDYISASFYDSKPGKYTGGYTLPKTIKHLRKAAEKYGLTNLIYGVDEGRILAGNTRGSNDDALWSRTVGYTWQGAYDARLFKQGIDNGLDYFSSWGWLSDAISGYPTESYHIANNLYKFAGSKKVETVVAAAKAEHGAEFDCLSVYNEQTQTVRLMIYNYKNDVNYQTPAEVSLSVKMPQFAGKQIQIVRSSVNDDCNFFDEWMKDRKTYNITDKTASWSPDDPCLDTTVTLEDFTARQIYQRDLRAKYAECAKLTPVTSTQTLSSDTWQTSITLGGSEVVFYEISLAKQPV